MSKAILLSIKPKWVEKILNGEKTIEIRKKFPKDYRGWVYIYCTQDKKHLVAPFHFREGWKYKEYNDNTTYANGCTAYMGDDINGKVVARFWCDFTFKTCIEIAKIADEYEQLLKDSCLTKEELEKYVDKNFCYAIHISKLEIFDKPKELSEFRKYDFKNNVCKKCGIPNKPNMLYCCGCEDIRLTKAPQNFCYVESEE